MSATQTIKYGTPAYTFPFHKMKVSLDFVYADDKRTLVGTMYNFVITGWVTQDTASLAQKMFEMRTILTKPRSELRIGWTPEGSSTMEDEFYFSRSNESAEQENEWGPKPKSLVFDTFTGGLAAAYTWEVSAFHKEVRNSATFQKDIKHTYILALTKEWDFQIDENGLTTRTVSGSIILDAVALGSNDGPSQYRDLCAPALPNGFHRTSNVFHVNADNISASFHFTDVERRSALPNPITGGQAVISARSSRAHGMVEYNLSGWFSAPKTTGRDLVLKVIYSLATQHLPTRADGFIPDTREISVELYDARVTFAFRGRAPRISLTGSTGQSLEVTTLLKPTLTSTQASDAGPWGTAQLTEELADYHDPYDAAKDATSSLRKQSPVSGITQRDATTPVAKDNAPPMPPSDVSAQNKATPILDYYRVREYLLTNQLVTFSPKLDKRDAVFQQTSDPRVYIIDAGYIVCAAESAAKLPQLPQPTSAGKLLVATIAPVSSTPYGDGSVSLYRLSWQYVMAVQISMHAKDIQQLKMSFPADIRRQSGKDENIDKGPTLPEIP